MRTDPYLQDFHDLSAFSTRIGTTRFTFGRQSAWPKPRPTLAEYSETWFLILDILDNMAPFHSISKLEAIAIRLEAIAARLVAIHSISQFNRTQVFRGSSVVAL